MLVKLKNVVPLHRKKGKIIVLHNLIVKKMKKLAFVFAAIVAVSFASCGNKTTATECADSTACDSVVCCDSVACDTVACDSVVCDSVVAE